MEDWKDEHRTEAEFIEDRENILLKINFIFELNCNENVTVFFLTNQLTALKKCSDSKMRNGRAYLCMQRHRDSYFESHFFNVAENQTNCTLEVWKSWISKRGTKIGGTGHSGFLICIVEQLSIRRFAQSQLVQTNRQNSLQISRHRY